MTALLLISLLVLPGWLFTSLVRPPGPRLLHTVGFSVTVFVLTFVSGLAFHWSYTTFEWVYWSLIAILAVIAIANFLRPGNNNLARIGKHGNPRAFYGAVIIISIVSLWLLLVGPYDEIPADILAHLGKIQAALASFGGKEATMRPGAEGHYLNAHTWYDMVAYALHVTRSPVADTLPWLHIISAIFFLLGYYVFVLYVVHEKGNTTLKPVLISVIATLLMAIHFGVNIFNFVRYYAYAPSIISFVVYFAGAALAIDMFRSRQIKSLSLLLIAAYTVTMAIVHTQEALFLAVISVLMLVIHATRGWAGQLVKTSKPALLARASQLSTINTSILLLLTLGGITLAWVYAHENLPLHQLRTGRLLPVLKLDETTYYLLNPKQYFYQVLTHWGVWVYLLFLFYFRQFLRYPYIIAGMLVPLLTIFNPFFIDLFLRFYTDTTIWRMSYIAPIHLVAAWLVVNAGSLIYQPSVFKRIQGAFILIPLMVLLLPIKVGALALPYSRLPTMGPVSERNSPDYLMDLVNYLKSYDAGQRIVTDPVTGYVITALTGHYSDHRKFFPINQTVDLRKYPEQELLNRRDWLVVINQRDGDFSENGRLAHHWWPNTLHTSKYYEPDLADILDSKPELYEKLWSADKIHIFRIKSDPR